MTSVLELRVSQRVGLFGWSLATIAMAAFLGLSEPADRQIALRTLSLGTGSAAIAIPLGGLLTWIMLGAGWLANVFRLAVGVLVFVPVFLHVSTWDAAFGKLGWLSTSEGATLTPLVSGWTAAVWIHAVAAAPQVALILWLGLIHSHRVFEEQALLETSGWTVFWRITFPRLWPLVMLSLLWTIIVCAREIAATDLYQIGTLAEQVYLGYSLGQFTAGGGNWTAEQLAAMGDLNIALSMALVGWLAVTAGIFFLTLAQTTERSESLVPRNPAIGGWLRRISGLILLTVMVLVPTINLLIRCGFYVRPIDGIPTPGYSWQQFSESLTRAATGFQAEFSWSMLIAATSASVIVGLGMIVAWAARHDWKWQWLLVVTLAISCAVPGPMLGTSVSKFFLSIDWWFVQWLYDRTIAAPVIANAVFCWPLAPLLLWFVFRNVATDTLEHSTLEGATATAKFLRLGIRANGRPIIGSWVLCFAYCFGELSASSMVLPPGIDTVPRLMLGLLHAGVDEMTAALTIVTSGGIVAISLAGIGLLRLHSVRRGRQ